MAKGGLRIGTSGYIYPHWREVYYPRELAQEDWFGYYSRDFDTVEINNTFYRLPAASVFRNWGEAAPKGFCYAFKVSRYLTHLKKLKDPAAPLDNFLERVRGVGASLGPLLYQLPPHWKVNPERLATFLELLPDDLLHVFEFRDASWHTGEIRDLLAAAGAAFCIHDHPSLTDCPDWVTGRAVYLRRHGPRGEAYAGDYPQAELEKLSERIAAWRAANLDVFVYFNNDLQGHAVHNARQLKALCAD
jgi:uncharacterized protein YecE (DUF72 family)